jgi:hypothetical protein
LKCSSIKDAQRMLLTLESKGFQLKRFDNIQI